MAIQMLMQEEINEVAGGLAIYGAGPTPILTLDLGAVRATNAAVLGVVGGMVTDTLGAATGLLGSTSGLLGALPSASASVSLTVSASVQ